MATASCIVTGGFMSRGEFGQAASVSPYSTECKTALTRPSSRSTHAGIIKRQGAR
jgi:hypothetical protein